MSLVSISEINEFVKRFNIDLRHKGFLLISDDINKI
jgi:hypothetical protein